MGAVTKRHEGTHVFDAVEVGQSISQGGNKILASVAEINKLRGIDTAPTAKVVQSLAATFTHEDATAKDLFALPAGAVLIGFQVFVTEAFNDTGTNEGDIGLKGTADDHYAAGVDVSTAGLKAPTYTNLGVIGAGGAVITGKFTGQNSDASQGAATVVALYFMP